MPFKPMLAGTADGKYPLTFPVLASPKLDGVRAIVKDGRVYGRSMKPLPSPDVQELFGKPQYEGLDGELILGSPVAEDVFRKTQGFVMRRGPQPRSGVFQLQFWVFDRIEEGIPFQDRLTVVEQIIAKAGPAAQLMVVPHTMMTTVNALDAYESQITNLGYEGVMTRDPDGFYKQGRSTPKEQGLMKVKRFHDSEAEVLEVIELQHNTNLAERNELGRTKRSTAKAGLVGDNRMGALRVKDLHSGVEFEIGTGFTDGDRSAFWALRHGKLPIVKYKHFPVGAKDKPRFPVYLGVRDPIDMDPPEEKAA